MKAKLLFWFCFLGMGSLWPAFYVETPPSDSAASAYESFYRELLSNFAFQKKIPLVFTDGKKEAPENEPILSLTRQSLETWDDTRRIGLPVLPVREIVLLGKKGRLRSDGEVLTRAIGILEKSGSAETLSDIEKQLSLKVEIAASKNLSGLIEKFSKGETVSLLLESDRAYDLVRQNPTFVPAPTFLSAYVFPRTLYAALRAPTSSLKATNDAEPDWIAWLRHLRDRGEGSAFDRTFQKYFGLSYSRYLQDLGGDFAKRGENLQRELDALITRYYEEELDRLSLRIKSAWEAKTDSPLLSSFEIKLKSYYAQGDPYGVDLKYLRFLDSSFRGKECLDRLIRSLPKVGGRYLSLSAEDPRKPAEGGPGIYSFQNYEDPIETQLELLRKQLAETTRASRWNEALAMADKILVLKPEDTKVKKSRQEILAHVEKEKESAWVRDLVQNSLESGNLLFNQKKYAEALEEYEKVLLLEKDHPLARKQKLVIEYLIREENKNRSLGKFQELLEKGILYFNTDQFASAVGVLESALDLIPGNTVAQEYLQLARGSLRNREESEIRAESPYYPLIHNYQRDGLKAFRESRYAESQAEWKKILFFFPKNREATRYSLACTLHLNPALFKKVIDEKLQEGFRLLKAKQNKIALPIFELIKDLAPETPGLTAYLQEARGVKIKPPPSLLQAKYEEALALYNQQDFERAKKIWKEILDLDDTEIQARLFIARVDNVLGYDRQKTADTSKSEREETIRRLQNQGLLYYNQGKYQDAIAEWEKILKINPDDKRALNNIRRAKQFLNFK